MNGLCEELCVKGVDIEMTADRRGKGTHVVPNMPR